jgi:hypothetical protein
MAPRVLVHHTRTATRIQPAMAKSRRRPSLLDSMVNHFIRPRHSRLVEDFVPRFSFMSLVHYHNFLLKVETQYSDWNLLTFLFWWTKENRAKLARAVMNYELIDDIARELHQPDIDYGLYIPGKILFVWKLGFKDSHGGRLEGRVTDASHPKLRFIQMVPHMLVDHGIANYRKDMTLYLQQQQQQRAAQEEQRVQEEEEESSEDEVEEELEELEEPEKEEEEEEDFLKEWEDDDK